MPSNIRVRQKLLIREIGDFLFPVSYTHLDVYKRQVWPWQRMVRLTGEMMDNQYVFTLPTDSNYKDRDTLVWDCLLYTSRCV